MCNRGVQKGSAKNPQVIEIFVKTVLFGLKQDIFSRGDSCKGFLEFFENILENFIVYGNIRGFSA